MDVTPVDPICPLGDREVTVSALFGSITIRVDEGVNFNMADVVGALVRPALLGLGYYASTVDAYVPDVY